MPSLRIACTIDTLGKGGGAEQLLATLVPRLAALDVEVEMIAVHDWPDDHIGALRDAGIVVHELHAPHRASMLALPAMARLARTRRYDLYWGHLQTGNMIARWGGRLTGAPVVATLHSEGYARNPPASWRSRVAVTAEGLVLRGAIHVAVSQAVADDYARYFGWPAIEVVHNGVDGDALRALARGHARSDIRAHFGYGPDEFLLVTPARFVEKKGQVHLLRAVARLRDDHGLSIRLLLCGSNAAASPLHADVVALGLHREVALRDVIAQPELLPLIAAADALVLPSLFEPFGIAACEAMAVETPAILSKVDGLVEIAGNAAGALLVPPADPAALADAILSIHRDPATAAAMAKRGRQRVDEHFGIDACARRWKAVFDSVLSRWHSAGAGPAQHSRQMPSSRK